MLTAVQLTAAGGAKWNIHEMKNSVDVVARQSFAFKSAKSEGPERAVSSSTSSCNHFLTILAELRTVLIETPISLEKTISIYGYR